MFKNYFKVAWRNLFRNKIYSTINIAGLAIGMAMALLIGIWITDELNVNKNFTNYDRVVRLVLNLTQNGHTETVYDLPAPLAPDLKSKFGSDFKAISRSTYSDHSTFSYGKVKLSRVGSLYVDPDMMEILSLKMISGGRHALNDLASIIIDRTLANDLFGKEDPLNKMVTLENKQNFRVTGVYENIPQSAEFSWIHYMMPWDQQFIDHPESMEKPADQPDWVLYQYRWDIGYNGIFAQLQDNTDANRLSAKIKNVLNGHGRMDHPEVILHPMSKWHLYGDFKDGKNTGGAIEFVKMFGVIGLFVLLLACINFMNLSTARSERRAREVGIRKSIGSLRFQLIFQFLGESLLITTLAIGLSVVLVFFALPWFNQLAGKQMIFPATNPAFWILLLGFTLVTGLIAGSYPAFYLSSFNAVKVLKGSLKAGPQASIPRKVLVVLQFTISIALIIGTIIVFQEIEYARNRSIGYERNGLLLVYRNTPDGFRNYDALRNDLMTQRTVEDMALSTGPLTQLYAKVGGWDWEGNEAHAQPVFGWLGVSPNFGKTVKWKIVQGRDFSPDNIGDSSSVILTESVVRAMGLKHPLNTIITSIYTEHPKQQLRVVGVIQDVIMESPFAKVTPVIYTMNLPIRTLPYITLKLNPSLPFGQSIATLKALFRKYIPDATFDYTVNSEEFAKNFILEQRIGILGLVFAIFAIFISCLGLFGLASFTAEQRTREIGIRKVLGASLVNLWGLLSREFLLLVIISFFIAFPAAYLFMHNWLQRYDYRTSISIWIFVATIGIALFITMITVSFQSIKASMANPIKSLRNE